MRKWFLFLISAILLLAASGTASAALPPNLGHVQDRAGFFTDEQKTELKKQAVAGPLSFYILTIASLDGEASGDYATAVYQSWKLKTDDVLVVISSKEHRVEMNFDNPLLQAKIDALADDYDGNGTVDAKLDELVNRHFIPLAKQGDFAGAAEALMKASDKLMPASPPASKPAAQPSPKSSVAPAASAKPQAQAPAKAEPAASPSPDDAPAKSSGVADKIGQIIGTIIFVLIAAVALAIALIPVAFVVYGLTLRRRLRALRERFASRMVEVNRLLEGFSPFASLNAGRTGAYAKEWTAKLEELLIRSQETTAAMEKKPPFLFRIRKMEQLIAGYTATFDKDADTAPGGEACLNQLREAERLSQPRVDALLATAARLRASLQDLTATLDSPLEVVARELAKLEELARKADETDAIDPVTSMDWIGQAEAIATRMESDLAELARYNEKLLGYPERAQSCRSQIGGIVERHFLHAIGFDPYAPLADSQERIDRCRAALKMGNLIEVRDRWEESEGLLNGAVKTVARLADLRQSNQARKGELEQRQLQLQEERDELSQRLQAARSAYASSLWGDPAAVFEQDCDRLAEADRHLDVARRLTADDRQQFDEAASEMDNVQSLQEDVAAAWRQARGMLEQWVARRQTAVTRVRAGSDLYRQTLTRIEKEDLICLERPNVQAAMESISRLQAAFAAAQAAPVCDLIELERLTLQLGEETNAFDEQIRELSGLKRVGEEELDQLERTFRSSYRQAAPYVSRGATKDAFKLRQSEIKRCLKEGRYEEIAPQLQAIRDLLEQIGDAYRKGVGLERERQLAAAQQAAYREQARAARQVRRASLFAPVRSSQPFRQQPPSRGSGDWHGEGSASSQSGRSPTSSSPPSSHSSGGANWNGGSSNSGSSGGSSSGGGSFGGGGKGGNSSGGANW